jgi:hypothetical protein
VREVKPDALRAALRQQGVHLDVGAVPGSEVEKKQAQPEPAHAA